MVQQVGKDDVLPVASIGHKSKIRERPFRGAHLLFPPCEEVAEVYDHVPIALPHVLGQDHNAGQVVVLRRLLLLKRKQ